MSKPRGYWTFERCFEDARQYSSKKEWAAISAGAYNAAKRNKWLQQCCAHMLTKSELLVQSKRYWTLEKCIEDAANYDQPRRWAEGSPSAWSAAQRNGWLDICQAHMVRKQKPPGYWTKQRCIDDAAQYDSRADWERGNKSAKSTAEQKGWMDECCAHMPLLIEHGKWTLEKCAEFARDYSTREDWRRGHVASYGAARAHGWMDECCVHMETYQMGDNDVVYLWNVDSTNAYKVGVTSDKTGNKRINMCKRNNGMTANVIFMLKVSDARAVEARLKELGESANFDPSIDGYTEFRVLTDQELGQAVKIAYNMALAA